MRYDKFLQDTEAILSQYPGYSIRLSSTGVVLYWFNNKAGVDVIGEGYYIDDIIPLYGYTLDRIDKSYYMYIAHTNDAHFNYYRYRDKIKWNG